MSHSEGLTPFMLGDWRVDPVLKQIVRAEERVRIDPRNMRVLVLLASCPGQIVSQSEIERVVWNGSVVTPNSVYQSIAQLRRALGEDKSSRRYIETISRKGYRVVVPVCAIDPAADAQLSQEASSEAICPVTSDAQSPSDTASEPMAELSPQTQLPPETAISDISWGARRSRLHRHRHLIAGSGLAAFGLLLVLILHTERQSQAVGNVAEQIDAITPAATIPGQLSSVVGLAGSETELPEAFQGAVQFRQVIQRLEAHVSVSKDDRLLVQTLVMLANHHQLVSEPLKTEQVARRGLAILIKLGQELSPEGVELNATLAEALADTERYPEAERYLLRASLHSREVHGDADYATISAIDQMALLRIAEGRFEEAVAEARRAVAAYERTPNARSTRKAYLRSTLTWALIEQGRYADAIAEGANAINIIKPGDLPAPYLAALAHHFLGEALLKVDRHRDAEAVLRRELHLLAMIPHCEMDSARAQSGLAEALMRQGHLQEAKELLAKASRTLEVGDGWRERKARRATRERLEQLHTTEARFSAGRLANANGADDASVSLSVR